MLAQAVPADPLSGGGGVPAEAFALVLAVLWGACVGSFLNVVVYRVPEGMSVVSPPSRCPGCEQRLAWFDNVPVLGWLWLRGRCRTCKMKISPQYPLVEAATALLFGVLTYAYYFTELRPPFAVFGVALTWPILGVHLTLVAAMLAASLIDAKLYIIPLGITWVASLVALAMPLSFALGLTAEPTLNPEGAFGSLVPSVGHAGLGAALGGMAGLGLAVLALRRGILPLSFAEEPGGEDAALPGEDPEAFLAHPHPRREVLKEVLFVLPPIAGAAVGLLAGEAAAGPDPAFLPAWSASLGGVLLGYLAGGAVVWFVRILGTLLFGKEAMGLGDVHLMAAVGAVIGAADAALAFFVAPFLGLLVAFGAGGISRVLTGEKRVIPYGPSLCVAVYAVMMFRNVIFDALAA